MDLTKYLRPSNTINSPSVETSKRREQYKNKNKISTIANRKNRANQAAESRKENRAKQILSRRGIPTTLESENDSSVLDKKSSHLEKAKERNNYKVINSEMKQKERLQKLQEFKQNQKLRKQKEKESKLPPFRTGIRGMRTSETDLYTNTTGIQTSTSFAINRIASFNSHAKANDIFVFTGKSDRNLATNKSTQNLQINHNPSQRLTRSQKAQISKTINEIQPEHQIPSTIAEVSEPDNNISMKTPPNPDKIKQSRCNTPWPVNARRPTPEVSESSEEEMEVKENIPNISVTKEKPFDQCEEEEESRDIVTPLRPPKSLMKRCPSSTSNKVSVLGDKINMLTPQHAEITIERGSFSERRRQKAGKSERKSFIDELNFDEVPPSSNLTTSPMSETLLRNPRLSVENEKTSGTIEKNIEISFSENDSKTKLQPKNLENMEYDINEVVEEKTDEVYNTEPTSNTLDISYFKSMLAKESEKLTSFCEEWNEKLLNSFITDNQNDDEIPEEKIEKDEIEGQIRATIGKAKILSDRKGRFTQFQVLINNCEFNLGEKKTTCTDLQGFWEMIYFQVEDCMHGFSELSEIEKNGWKNVKSKPIQTQCKSKKIVTKKVTVTNGTKKISIKDKKPSSNIREMMAAKRREMALAKKKELSDQNEPTNTVEPNDHKVSSPISVSATTSESTEKTKDVDNNEEKVFDGGFFSIQSPVSSRKNTPVSATKSNTRGSSTSTPSSQKNTPVQK